MPTVGPMTSGNVQFFDSSGNPLNGGKVWSYITGGTTPKATYTDSTGGTPNTNPVILDSAGRANIWLESGTYRLKLTTSADVQIWQQDGITSLSTISLAVLLNPAGGASQTIAGPLSVTGNITPDADGTRSLGTALLRYNASLATVIAKSLNTIRFVDSTNTEGWAGSDMGAWINAADAVLGATVGELWVIGGGTITTNVSISTNHTLRIFPGAYSGAGSITLAANTALIGENPRSTALTMTLANTHQIIVAGSNVVVRGLELVQTGSGTGNNIHCSGSYSQLRIEGNEFQSGYHAFYYALGGSSANSLWFTKNLVNTCGRADSAVAILNLNGVVATPILSDVHVEGNIFSGSGASAGISASQIYCSTSSLGIRNAVYANNTVFNSSGGGLWGAGVDGLTFTGNHIYTTANEGIDAEFSQNVSMTGNVIKNASGTAITILGLVGGAVNTTSTTSVSAGTIATVTPAAMTNIVPLGQLYVDSAGTPETVQVLSVTATTFTAYFASAHGPSSWNIVGAGTSNNTVSISRNIAIVGNAVESSGSASAGTIHVVNATRVSVTGNTIHNPVYHGIQVGVSGGAGSHLYINDLAVVGNSISSDTLTTSTVGIRFDNGGVAGQQEGIIVSGNSVHRFPFGIVLTGSSNEQSVCGLNNLRNCTTDYTTDGSSLPSTSILAPYVGTNINGLYFGGAKDTNLYRSAAGVLSTSYANGETWARGSISELITLSTVGLTTDSSANLLPSNSIIECVVARVTTTITTTTSWALGDAAQAARFASANTNLTAGSGAIGLNHQDPTVATANLGPVQGSAAKLRITCAGANPGAGVIRVTVFYRQFGAPTS